MKIAFLFHPQIVRIPFKPKELWTDSRGLTGSEVTYFKFATELAKLGHEVVLFSKFDDEGIFENCKYLSYDKWEPQYCKQDWDVAFSSIMAHPLRFVSSSTFKIFNQQCCGFLSDAPGWGPQIDILAPLSHTHARVLKTDPSEDARALPDHKWRVLNNGVDLEKFNYDPKVKIPHKLIWASSHDRGLHWLLEAFPKIRNQVPDVELHIFYSMHSVYATSQFFPDSGATNDLIEQGMRARYILEAISKLKNKGVFIYDSVSRSKIEEEMHTASILAYPLDPVYFTETFGVVVLEACASGVVPVICATDAFPELWGSVSESVLPPYSDHKEEWISKVVSILTNDSHRLQLASKAAEYARQFSWSVLAKGLEEFMTTRSTGIPKVQWDQNLPIKESIQKKEFKASTEISNASYVSIILPTVRVGGLDVLFHGLSRQTFKNFELILVDGIYKHRCELVQKKAIEHSIKVVHVEPFDNPFPVCSYSRFVNTGLVHASGELVVFISDYTWLPPECLQKHVDAFRNNGPRSGLMGPHDYTTFLLMNSEFKPYDEIEIDRYVSDVVSGRYDSMMWSIFDQDFNMNATILDKDPAYVNADCKLSLPSGPVNYQLFNGKNESCSLGAALDINGFDEDLDGTNTMQDIDFTERITSKQSISWYLDTSNIVHIINPRHYFPWPRRIRPVGNNEEIFLSKKSRNFPPVNSWNLKAARTIKK
jgi:glycosyltransferase involved in cell wall biosynthesis